MSNLDPNQNQNPMGSKNFLVAVVLIIGFILVWQAYLSKRYPPSAQAPTSAVVPGVNASRDERAAKATSMGENSVPADSVLAGSVKDTDAKSTPSLQPEKLFEYEDEKVRFVLSSHGMGLKEYILKNYKDLNGDSIRLGHSVAGELFETRLNATNFAVDYDVNEIEKGVFEGTAHTVAGTVKRSLKYDKEKGSFESSVVVSEATPELVKGFLIVVPDTIQDTKSTSWLFPSYAHQDFFISHAGTTETVNFSKAKENLKRDFENVSLVSVGDQYFSTAVLDQSEIAPSVVASINVAAKTASADIEYKPQQSTGDVALKQIFYAGPKSIDVLSKIDPAMASIVDFGWLTVIAKPLAWGMKAFHSVVGNWGFAIILLTLLVRFIVLPFNLMSVRSMKAMQKIQPLMQQTREKYKDDPMTQQREIMALMKQHKANPLGGCLPMLFQIPVFFAMYRVIGSSVELYRSPFILWIHDLSQHDPFYILPLLMGVTMFFQSKLTPTTADPAQQKIMQWMPVIFTVFMLNLPAGLTLYMVVSSVFGIVQQSLVLRDKKVLVAA